MINAAQIRPRGALTVTGRRKLARRRRRLLGGLARGDDAQPRLVTGSLPAVGRAGSPAGATTALSGTARQNQ